MSEEKDEDTTRIEQRIQFLNECLASQGFDKYSFDSEDEDNKITDENKIVIKGNIENQLWPQNNNTSNVRSKRLCYALHNKLFGRLMLIDNCLQIIPQEQLFIDVIKNIITNKTFHFVFMSIYMNYINKVFSIDANNLVNKYVHVCDELGTNTAFNLLNIEGAMGNDEEKIKVKK